MNRREFLKRTAAAPVLPLCGAQLLPSSAKAATSVSTTRRVRPPDPEWPSAGLWETLRQEVGGRLLKLKSPVAAFQNAPESAECREFFRGLKNPYLIGDNPALTQTSGWVDAWTSRTSDYAVAAARTEDVVAAVNFARVNRLRLVVKGGGHSYQGTSNSVDSLLIWTRAMNSIVLHDSFVPTACDGVVTPQPAVTAGAGVIWKHLYDAVTTKGGRYVQGGGCATVGVAGLIQSGGFGPFSKMYGMAAAGLLEAEIVAADGIVRVANACQNPELFWGIKGGGGGSLGVVTKLTLRTRELPEFFGGVFGGIKARSDSSFRTLTSRIMRFYRERLFNPQWGEQITFGGGNQVRISMLFHGFKREDAEAIWRPLLDWVRSAPDEFVFEEPIRILDIPARHFWDASFFKQHLPEAIISDDRPGAPEGNFYWAANLREGGQILNAYRSAWLPEELLKDNQHEKLVDALVAASRHWGVSLHFNKGLAGAPEAERLAAKDTATNPLVLDAFALAIIASNSPPAFPGLPGHEPDIVAGRRYAADVNRSMDELLKVVKSAGSYVSESDYFERSWQESFWGTNYPRLAAVKRKYDPEGLFFIRHGVGSEGWSADGFERLKV